MFAVSRRWGFLLPFVAPYMSQHKILANVELVQVLYIWIDETHVVTPSGCVYQSLPRWLGPLASSMLKSGHISYSHGRSLARHAIVYSRVNLDPSTLCTFSRSNSNALILLFPSSTKY